MNNEDVPLFSLPVPELLTNNIQGEDENINLSGIDTIQGDSSGGGGGGGGGSDFSEKVFWSVEDVGGVSTPVEYIFLVKEVT